MKNLAKIFMVMAAALFAFSCVTDSIEESAIHVGKGATSLTVSLEESKTQLGERNADGKYPLYWSEGDQIAINGVASEPLSASYNGNAVATFQFGATLNAPYCLVYPAVAGAGEGTTYPVNFLAEQAYTEGTFAAGAAPMYGYAASASDAVQINHLTGILRLAIKGNGEALTSVVFTSGLGKIAGPFTVDCTNGSLTAQEGASNTVTLTFAEPLVLGAETQYLYIAVPAGSYGEFGVTLHTATDKMAVKFNSTSKPIAAGMVREFKELTYGPNDEEVESSAFEIDSKDALIEFASNVAAGTFTHTAATVVANIDMTGVAWTPISGFDGKTFDGGKASGFAINGLSAPLFGTTSSTIQNVDLTNVNIASNGRLVLGAVACELATEGSLTNCHTSGTITVSNPEATIASDADLYKSIAYGGVVGHANGDITNCHNEVNITVNQVAKSDNTVALHPSLGGIVGYSEKGCVTNCVNGNEAKTTGAISYHDNQQELLYVPYVAGVAGFRALGNATDLTGNKNYGAIDFGANAAGNYGLNEGSVCVGGVVGYTKGTVSNNDNYGTINISSGSIIALMCGGVAGVVQPTIFSEGHNHQGASITVDEDVTFGSLNVGGVLAAIVGEGSLEKSSNDAPLVSKASSIKGLGNNSAAYYRVAGIATYTNRTVTDCENKANGDITVSGDVILLRTNNQACYGIVGAIAYYALASGVTTNVINRGDINVYTNVSMHGKVAADATYGKLNIAGVGGYITGAFENIQNYGNITIGKKDVAQTITSNGALIAGCISHKNSKTVNTAINQGNITIANKVTFANALDAAADDKNLAANIFIGGILGYTTGGSQTPMTNSGAITLDGTLSEKTYIGGVTAYSGGGINTIHNNAGGNITIGGKIGGNAYIGGVVGWANGTKVEKAFNAAAVTTTSTATFSGETRIGGVAGHATGNLEGVNNNVGGNVTIEGTLDNTAYIGGVLGYSYGPMTNCTNSGAITTSSTAHITGVARIGGVVGHATGNLEGVKNNAGGNVSIEGTFDAQAHFGGITAYYGYAADGKTAELTLTSCENHGNVTLNATTNSKLATYLGGLAAEFFGTAVTNCSNSGDITLTKCSSKSYTESGTAHEVWVNLGGLFGYTRTALTLTNCNNSGTISSAKSLNQAFVFTAAGFIGGSKVNITLDNCHNTMKPGAEWGIKLENTIPNGSGSSQSRAGGFFGWQSSGTLTTKNGVSNSANIYIAIKNSDSGGSSYGGIAGVLGGSAHSFGGTVSNSGNIYYAGTSNAGTFCVAGLFGQTGNKAPTLCEDLRNTGNITVTNEGDKTNWKPTAKKNGLIGGIVGTHSVALSNAKFYGTITAVDFEDTHVVSGTNYTNSVGAIIGNITSANLTNCHAGGKIVLEKKIDIVGGDEEAGVKGEEQEIDVPGVLTVANYAAYLSGDHTFSSATAKTQKCGFITSIDDTTPEYAN